MAIRRSLFVLTLFVLGLPFFVFVRAHQRDTSAVAQQLATVQLYEVRRGTVTLSVSAIGVLEPHLTTTLSFATGGRVSDVFVQRDDYVLAGDVLVQLDNTLQRIAYDQAVLGVERAELALQDLLEVDETSVALAQAALDSAWGAYISVSSAVSDLDIAAAQLAYDQALQAVDTAREEHYPQYQMYLVKVSEAETNAEIARLQLENLKNGTRPQSFASYNRVLQAQAELDRVKAGAPQVQIDAATIAIEQAEGQLTRAETAYNRTFLRAPFDGVIASLNVELGALVAPAVAVVELVDVYPLSLKVQVDEVDIALIRENLPVRVELDALPDVLLPAKVIRIAPSGVNTGGIVSYEVEIELLEDDPRARVGMTAEATIVVNEAVDVVTVPNLYLRIDRDTEQAFVRVLRDDNTIEEVPIVIGLQGQESTHIIFGLSEGSLIVTELGQRRANSLFGG